VRPLKLHAARHTYASLSIMAGMTLMVLAENLGHSDTRMVEKHYGIKMRKMVEAKAAFASVRSLAGFIESHGNPA